MYFDANNLYGVPMADKLPTGGFQMMTEHVIPNWYCLPEGKNCILEVDMEYPDSLYKLHNDYPLAPESLLVNGVRKLIPNLHNKKNYVVHAENLKQYVAMGLKITKIHKGIIFDESAWMKPYIDMNTNLRAQASNEFEKSFYKQMNLAPFGKTMEDIEKHVDIKLVTCRKQAVKLFAKPHFQKVTKFDENLIAVHMVRTHLCYNKPVYLGMSILDKSKIVMYDFHYNFVNPKWGDRAKLLLTDTDSLLMYHIQTDDAYDDIKNDLDRFDTSDYPVDHPLYSTVNKTVLGKFKDDCNGRIIKEFVGLRAKHYSYKMFNNKAE
jgi:hypothetical protein